MTTDDIINEVKNSNLRGRGGAAFPTGVEVELHPEGLEEAGLRLRQRR